jgi:hypothetical protein
VVQVQDTDQFRNSEYTTTVSKSLSCSNMHRSIVRGMYTTNLRPGAGYHLPKVTKEEPFIYLQNFVVRRYTSLFLNQSVAADVVVRTYAQKNSRLSFA